MNNCVGNYGYRDAIVAGRGNEIYSRGGNNTIVNGFCNKISSPYAGYSGDANSIIGGGNCNLINVYNNCQTFLIGENVIAGGRKNRITNLVFGTKNSGSSNFIGAGCLNTGSGNFNFIGSGRENSIKASNSVIVGGFSNTASGNFSSIVGGFKNTSSAKFSSIVGGTRNYMLGGYDGYNFVDHKFIGGGCLNRVGTALAYQGGRFSSIVGGNNNIVDQASSFIGGGNNNRISSYGNSGGTIGGGFNNDIGPYASSAFIGGGFDNYVGGNISLVAGGCKNNVSGNCAFIGGGSCNCNYSTLSFIGAGYKNKTAGYEGANGIVSGKCNNITYGNNTQGFIGGGFKNCINGNSLRTSIVGGCKNSASLSSCSFIGGGYCNILKCSIGSSIVGGVDNIISGSTRSISSVVTDVGNFNVIGGSSNKISGSYTAVFGLSNTSSKHCAHFIAGEGNSINSSNNYYGNSSPNHSTIAGGYKNTITDQSGFIGGGRQNIIGGYFGGYDNVLGGGRKNKIEAFQSSILGGTLNTASGNRSVIGGGCKNYISKFDNHAGILGGRHNCIDLTAIPGGVSDDIFLIGSYLTASATGAVCELITYMNNAVVTGSLTVGGGDALNATVGRIDAKNDIVAFSTSDKRLKCNIQPIDNALCKVIGVTGNTFDWKELNEEERKTIHGNTGRDVGVIAQEIEKILPEAVTTRDSGYKAVNYEKIVPLLIEAIKEQQKQIDELKSRL